jgi:hypothetical protein
LVKEFVPAVGPIAPRQHRDRINGESKVILASLQGILRRQLRPKRFDFPGGVCRLFQLGFHGTALIGFVHITNKNYVPHKLPFHKRNTPSLSVHVQPSPPSRPLACGLSLIASTRGVELLPVYAKNFPPSSVTSRPLKGNTSTVDLVLGGIGEATAVLLAEHGAKVVLGARGLDRLESLARRIAGAGDREKRKQEHRVAAPA